MALKLLRGGLSGGGIGAYNALAVATSAPTTTSVNRLAYAEQPTTPVPTSSTSVNPLAVAPTPTKDDLLGPSASQPAPPVASTSYNALAVSPSAPKSGGGLFAPGPSGYGGGGSSSPSSPSAPSGGGLEQHPPTDDRFGGAPAPKGEPYQYVATGGGGEGASGEGETSPMTSKKISRAIGSSLGVSVEAPDYVWYAVGGLLLVGGAWLLYKRSAKSAKRSNPRRRRRRR